MPSTGWSRQWLRSTNGAQAAGLLSLGGGGTNDSILTLSNQTFLQSQAGPLDLSGTAGAFAGQALLTYGGGAGGGGNHSLYTYNFNSGSYNWDGGLSVPGSFVARTFATAVIDGAAGDGHLFATSNYNNNVLGIVNFSGQGYSTIDFLSHVGFSDCTFSLGWGNTSAVGTNYQGIGYLAMNNSKPFMFTGASGNPVWGLAGGSTPNSAADTYGDLVRIKTGGLNVDPTNVVFRVTGAGSVTMSGALTASGTGSVIGKAAGTTTLLGTNIVIGDASGLGNNGPGSFGKVTLTDSGGSMCNLALNIFNGWQIGRDGGNNFMMGWCLGTIGTNLWVDTSSHELILQVSGGPTSFKGTLSGNGSGLTNIPMASMTGTVTNLAATQTAGNNSTQIATTAYVDQEGGWVISSVSGSDATTTGQALVDVTGLTFVAAANTTYEFESVLYATTTAVTTGTEYGIANTGAGSGVTCFFTATGATNAATGATYFVSATNSATQPFLLASSQSGMVVLKGMIVTLGGTPTLSVRHLKVTSGTSTVKQGSNLKVRKLF